MLSHFNITMIRVIQFDENKYVGSEVDKTWYDIDIDRLMIFDVERNISND